jgi:hypothetical protein
MERHEIIERIAEMQAQLLEGNEPSIVFTSGETKCCVSRTPHGLRYGYRSLLPEEVNTPEELADYVFLVQRPQPSPRFAFFRKSLMTLWPSRQVMPDAHYRSNP